MQDAINKVHEMFRDPEWTKQFGDADELLQNTMAWVQQMHDRQLAHAERMRAIELGEPQESVGASWAAMLTAVFVTLIAFCAACGGTVLLAIYTPHLLDSLGAIGIIWGVAAGVSFFAVVESAKKLRASRSKRQRGRSVSQRKAPDTHSEMQRVEDCAAR